ncbi:LysR family transcriptional regulator, partial [Acinetobacter baumannii]|uniref:LysR family transcriptional regulator n=1 Tax=Acinetobacter baumannii TaxID=470 RepID=UPI0018979956
ELRQLRYVVAVAEHGHFGRAAAELHMAQPALSRAVRKFEAELGAELFTRSTRSVVLTAAGAELVPEARLLLTRAERLGPRVRQVAEGLVGTLRIGCTGSASYGYLPRLIRELSVLLPGLEYEVETEMLTPDQERALLEGRLDLGIIRLPVTSDELEWRV